MKPKEAEALKVEAGMEPCWLVWEAAPDGGRPYLIAVDTSEEQAALHVRAKKEESRVLDKLPPMLKVEESWLDHLYGESMTKSFDEAKKMAREIQRVQIVELKIRLQRAIEIGRKGLSRPLTDRDRDARLEELTALEKIL